MDQYKWNMELHNWFMERCEWMLQLKNSPLQLHILNSIYDIPQLYTEFH